MTGCLEHYDVIVIGSGPGGYVSAIRCSQLGLKTLCIEKCGDSDKPILGGTCLNVGCIPSKALLDSSYKFFQAEKELKFHGILMDKLSVDVIEMQKRKEKIVLALTKGVQGLFKLNHVDSIQGEALVEGVGKVSVMKPDNSKVDLTADYIIIATGSRPIELPSISFDQKSVLTSTEALNLQKVPERLAVIGAGAIGLEIGSIWSRLGSEVEILETLKDFLPSADKQISSEALKILTKQGITIKLAVNVQSAEITNDEVTVKYVDESGEQELIVDKLIVAVGRTPAIQNVLGQNSGVEIDDKGFIKVNSSCETSKVNIYAIGDTVYGPMLAHKATEEGMMVAENIAGESIEIDYERIPAVIYTHPEIAWVGLTEEQANDNGLEIKTGFFPFSANGRALTSSEGIGFVKVIADAKDDSIQGIHVIGPAAADIVQQGVIAMNLESTAEDLSLTMFSHPTFSEAFHEAALFIRGKAIQISNRKR